MVKGSNYHLCCSPDDFTNYEIQIRIFTKNQNNSLLPSFSVKICRMVKELIFLNLLGSREFMWWAEPFLSTLQKVNFCQVSNIFCTLAVFFCILKNYHPMQKIMSVVIRIYKFSQEFFITGIFWNILYKYQNTIPTKAG